MKFKLEAIAFPVAVLLLTAAVPSTVAFAQEQVAAADASQEASPAPLSADELEILVARIALYPDELIAVISEASLYPLQIVEAGRFLGQFEKDKTLKPKDSWDGSVISLLNYPEIVKMMSDDLDWTQSLGDALTYQQKDVLIAIQQLRDEAVAKGVIKSDDKIQVTTEQDNVVIKSASPEVIYVPQYDPQMFYVPNYAWAPIRYYPDPYPYYYNPAATFFAGAVTGAIWASVVDWNDWGVWGGHWHGNDIDINCRNCFNNRDFNGKVNFNDVDWKNVDRSKINIDKNQFNKIDRTKIKNDLKLNSDNSIRNKTRDIKKNDKFAGNRPGAGDRPKTQDIRKNVQDGLKNPGSLNKPGNLTKPADNGKPNLSKPAAKPAIADKPNLNRPSAKPANVSRPAGKPKPAAKIDNRPSKPSGLGNVDRGSATKVTSNRGGKSMGGGQRGGGGHKQIKRPGGGGGGGGGGRRR
ncbi:MAG: DUF3300 domain-containing protein [Hyphomicrobiales bacterium]|nr:DUF3300 domain-containing protein [Hyphomicrobiales bacterium]